MLRMRADDGALAQAQDAIWLLWWNQYLVGAYGNEDSCRDDADDARRAARELEGAQGGVIRVTKERLAKRSHRATRSRQELLRNRAVADLVQTYGLVEAPLRLASSEPQPVMVDLGLRRGFPGFQFCQDGSLRPGLAVAIRVLRQAGWDDLSIAIWFSTPQGAANGRVPAAALPHDPMLVVEAAHSSAAG